MAEQNEFIPGNGRSMADNYYNWPLEGIRQPQENDVMCGRGGKAQHHPGNIRYREMAKNRKVEYVNSKDKQKVSEEIVRKWRAQIPPGRFLEFDYITGLWNDVGDKEAQKKVSQAIRDMKAPQIRKQQQEGRKSEGNTVDKTTGLAAGATQKKSKGKKSIVARNHSLGREYYAPDERIDVAGFAFEPRSPGVYAGEQAFQGPCRRFGNPPIAMGAYCSASSQFNVTDIAKRWSGGGHTPPDDAAQTHFGRHSLPPRSSETSPSQGSESQAANSNIRTPCSVKRDTSNSNETYESKRNGNKRAALNRDQSATSNRLKEEYIPEVFNQDMQSLPETMEQIRLSSPGSCPMSSPVSKPVPDSSKPGPLSQDGRMTTEEAIADCFGDSSDNQPPQAVPLDANGRMSTVSQRPSALTEKNRLSTTDIFALAGDDGEPLPL